MLESQGTEEAYWSKVNEILHADETKFEVDQAIVWTRESKGKVVKKHGTIAAIVAPDRVPNKEDFPSLYGRHPESPNDIGKTRKGYSYVVRWKDGSISWPLAQYLSPYLDEIEKISDSGWEAAVSSAKEVAEKTSGKPLVEVFAEEEASRIAKGVTEAYAGSDEVTEPVSSLADDKARMAEMDRMLSMAYTEQEPPLVDDLEDVEAQVERELEEVTTQEPPWNNPSSRMFMHQDGHDGHDIKTDSDPDRELGHHMRGVIRIISEALFGKRNKPDTLKERDHHESYLRDEISRLEGLISIRDAEIEKNLSDIARLNERIQKEMSFQTQISTQADATVDKLQKEIEVLCKESESLTDENDDLRLARQTAIEDVEHWKLEFNRVLDQREKLQDVLNLYQSSDNLVTDETKLVDTYKEQIEHYKNVCLDLNNQIENLESHAEKREEQIAAELEKIEKLEAEVKDFKTKNEILPDEAVKHLRSEVIRLQGELDTAKTTIEHYKNQVKPKSGRKVTSDKDTVMEAFRWAMDRTARAWSSNENYTHTDRQFEVSYQQWMETVK